MKGEITLKEYTHEEYETDMRKLLVEKGLKGAVKEYLDKIDEEVSGTRYIMHRTVQEYLCDVLYLVELYEKQTSVDAALIACNGECDQCKYGHIRSVCRVFHGLPEEESLSKKNDKDFNKTESAE